MKTKITVTRAPLPERYPCLEPIGCWWGRIFPDGRFATKFYVEFKESRLKIFDGRHSSSIELSAPDSFGQSSEEFRIYFHSNEQLSQWLLGGMDLGKCWKPESEYVPASKIDAGTFLEAIMEDGKTKMIVMDATYGLCTIDGIRETVPFSAHLWPLRPGDYFVCTIVEDSQEEGAKS